MDWTPKQHLEHQALLERMERERKANPGKLVRRKARGKVNDLNPANSTKPNAGQRNKKKKTRAKL